MSVYTVHDRQYAHSDTNYYNATVLVDLCVMLNKMAFIGNRAGFECDRKSERQNGRILYTDGKRLANKTLQ